MRTILKFRWLVLALWLAAAAGLMLSAPNMADLVREKGQITVPDDYPSSVAARLLSELGGEIGLLGRWRLRAERQDEARHPQEHHRGHLRGGF